jgi:hypothetical protein
LGKLVDATSGIDETSFTGEERVARGADTDLQVLDCGERLIDGTAGAADGGFEGGWVDSVFHGMIGHGRLARLRGASTVLSPERGG